MKMRVDPILLAVALGLLHPAAFQVEGDLAGEATPPPMAQALADRSGDTSNPKVG